MGDAHVIVLEKQPKRARSMEVLLMANGHAVTVVRSPAALMQSFVEHNPAIAVLDILHPAVAELNALHALPSMWGSLAMVLIARRGGRRFSATKLFEVEGKEWRIVLHDLESLPQAVNKCARHLEGLRGVLRVGTADTTLDTTDSILMTASGSYEVSAAVCNTLGALLRAYPHAVKEKDLRKLVGYASDAKTYSVYSRIYDVRQTLLRCDADIAVKTGGGYRVVIVESQMEVERRERERERV